MFRILTLIILLLFPLKTFGYSWEKAVLWNKIEVYNECSSFIIKSCKLHYNIQTKTNSISVGQTIELRNKKTKKVFERFIVKGIALDGNKCWITKKPGEADTYLTVSGCRRKR